MSLFGRSRSLRPQLVPRWSFEAPVPIWRLRIAATGHVLLELRDPEAKRTEFACVRERDGAVLWTGLSLDEPWWIGVEDMEDGRLYLHGFRKPDMPQHQGVRAYDLDSGTPLWRHDDRTFVAALGDTVFCAQDRFSGLCFQRLDATTGAVTADLGDDMAEVNLVRSALNAQDPYRDYRYPEPADSLPAREAASLHALTGGRAVDAPEALFSGARLWAAWHEHANGALNHVIGAAEDGRVLHRDILAAGVHASGADSFFVKGSLLYTIRDRRTLLAYPVTGDAA